MSSLMTTISRVIWQIEGSGESDNECGTAVFKGDSLPWTVGMHRTWWWPMRT